MPLEGTCLLDLGEDDVTLETLQKELGYLEKFTSTSLQAFSKYFETADLSGAEGAAALYCLSAFFNRLQVISLRAGTLAGELLDSNKVDYHDALKKLTSKAKAEGLQPEDSRIEDLVETQKDADWEAPAAGKGKVEFRHSVSMVAHRATGSEDAEDVSHQPIKAEFTRKKVRKATGYAKFNFAAEDLQESANKSDDETEATILGSQSSARKTPNSVASAVSGSRASAAIKKSDDNPFSLLCCFCPNADWDRNDNEVIRRSSSVSLGNVQEIQDKDADENWHDSERQSGRFARIRGRMYVQYSLGCNGPTGHASLMKSSSDDMLDALLAEDTEEGRRARELLLHNTQLNSYSPPFSPRSCCSDSPSPSDDPANIIEARCSPTTDSGRFIVKGTGVLNSGPKASEGSTGVLSILECHITSCASPGAVDAVLG